MPRLHESCRNHGGKDGWEGGRVAGGERWEEWGEGGEGGMGGGVFA